MWMEEWIGKRINTERIEDEPSARPPAVTAGHKAALPPDVRVPSTS